MSALSNLDECLLESQFLGQFEKCPRNFRDTSIQNEEPNTDHSHKLAYTELDIKEHWTPHRVVFQSNSVLNREYSL